MNITGLPMSTKSITHNGTTLIENVGQNAEVSYIGNTIAVIHDPDTNNTNVFFTGNTRIHGIENLVLTSDKSIVMDATETHINPRNYYGERLKSNSDVLDYVISVNTTRIGLAIKKDHFASFKNRLPVNKRQQALRKCKCSCSCKGH